MTRRALIVKTTSMGDVIHALPAVADLAKAQPDLQIDWVVEKSFADIPRLSRYVNTVHEVAVRQWRKHVLSSQTWREVGRVRAALQSAHYERVVDLQGLLKSEWNTKEDKPRKYYLITEDGNKFLKKAVNHWKEFSSNVNKIIDE